MRKQLIGLVLVVGLYAIIRLLAEGEWDAAVVAVIAVSSFVLDYYYRRMKDDE